MTRDIRVSVTLDGFHSLEPEGVKEACANVERALSGGPIPYAIYCLDQEFSKSGTRSPELATIDVNRISYAVFWRAPSAFRVPDALHDVVESCIRATGKVRVRASAEIGQVPITPSTIGDGSHGEKVSTIMFELPPPGTARENPACKISLDGMASPSGTDTARITLFGECEPDIADVAKATKRVLESLSEHCEAYGKWAQSWSPERSTRLAIASAPGWQAWNSSSPARQPLPGRRPPGRDGATRPWMIQPQRRPRPCRVPCSMSRWARSLGLRE